MQSNGRIRIISYLFIAIAVVSFLRLFYLQIIRHNYYSQVASVGHQRKYELAAKRGRIYLQSRGQATPVALNRNLKTLYADPRYIINKEETAKDIAHLTGNNYRQYLDLIEAATVYTVLEKEVEPEIADKIEELELAGIGLSDNFTREYPENSLASHVLGFVNAEGKGQYGIEQHLNDILSGRPGLLSAKTDTRGIPIATSDNVQIEPRNGQDVVLTIDRNLQAKVESVLKRGFASYQPKALSAVVIDPNSGAVKAMANYPTFNPNKYQEVGDYSVFINRVTHGLFEPGSGFKVYTMSAGLNEGIVSSTSTYHDTGAVSLDGYTIKNAIPTSGTKTMTSVITESLNTGMVHVLKQLGGGEINDRAKNLLYEYLTRHFQFGKPTGIEQPDEPAGTIYKPREVSNVAYANMTFGQGLSATMMQTVAALSSVVNGGTYYKPYVVDRTIDSSGKITKTTPEIVARNVISSQTSEQIKAMMETVVEFGGGYGTKINGYRLGGKTGTAQIPNPAGGYFNNRDIGSFTGFATIGDPKYVMMVRVDEPRVAGFAGSAAAGPLFGDIMKWLLNYSGIPPSN